MFDAHPTPVTAAGEPSLASRRAFLAGALGAAGLLLLDPRGLAAARRAAAALPPGDPFPLGVASGDPTATGVVLWTRLLSPDPATPLPATDVAVDWEVATDQAFGTVVASGTAPAVAALAHSVHVEVDGLAPDTVHWYRFRVDGETSPVGRTRTFPGRGVTPDRVRFALASCQNWADGYYTAHAAIAADDVEFVVFVGDYIYEGSANRPPRPISLPLSKDVPTYRARYELYRSDPNLRAAHAAHPWIITMDDHEVANNVLGDRGPDGELTSAADRAAFLQRRADAFQVWYEHLPVRLAPPTGSSYRIHRAVEHSDLLRFLVLDGRQYRSTYPADGSLGGDVPARHDPDRSMLGADQETWLYEQVGQAPAHWNAIAQQTVFTAMPVPVGDGAVYNFDQWDGYTANRDRLVRALVDARVRNPMILSGDIHLAAAAAIRLDFEDPDSPDVAHEVVCTSISSRFDPTLLDVVQAALDAAPWARYANAHQRGYSRITVTPESWTTEFRVVDVTVPQAEAATDFTDVVPDREPVTLPPPMTTPTTAPSTTTPGGSGGGGVATAPGARPVAGRPSYTG